MFILGLGCTYLKHLLTEISKHMDITSLTFLDNLLPWSENLPEKDLNMINGAPTEPRDLLVKVILAERPF